MTLQDCVVQRIYRLLIQMDWTMKQLSEQCGIPLAELDLQSVFHLSPGIFRCTHVSAALSAGNTITAAIFSPIKIGRTDAFLTTRKLLFCRFFVSLLEAVQCSPKLICNASST